MLFGHTDQVEALWAMKPDMPIISRLQAQQHECAYTVCNPQEHVDSSMAAMAIATASRFEFAH